MKRIFWMLSLFVIIISFIPIAASAMQIDRVYDFLNSPQGFTTDGKTGATISAADSILTLQYDNDLSTQDNVSIYTAVVNEVYNYNCIKIKIRITGDLCNQIKLYPANSQGDWSNYVEAPLITDNDWHIYSFNLNSLMTTSGMPFPWSQVTKFRISVIPANGESALQLNAKVDIDYLKFTTECIYNFDDPNEAGVNAWRGQNNKEPNIVYSCTDGKLTVVAPNEDAVTNININGPDITNILSNYSDISFSMMIPTGMPITTGAIYYRCLTADGKNSLVRTTTLNILGTTLNPIVDGQFHTYTINLAKALASAYPADVSTLKNIQVTLYFSKLDKPYSIQIDWVKYAPVIASSSSITYECKDNLGRNITTVSEAMVAKNIITSVNFYQTMTDAFYSVCIYDSYGNMVDMKSTYIDQSDITANGTIRKSINLDLSIYRDVKKIQFLLWNDNGKFTPVGLPFELN